MVMEPASLSVAYSRVPSGLSASEYAPPPVRDIIDMTDAVAQDAMERAIAIDAIADQELAAADQINTNVQSAAPGTAPIIEATTTIESASMMVWLIPAITVGSHSSSFDCRQKWMTARSARR